MCANDLQGVDVAPQTFGGGGGAGGGQPGLSFRQPAVGAVDHLFMLLHPGLDLDPPTTIGISMDKYPK